MCTYIHIDLFKTVRGSIVRQFCKHFLPEEWLQSLFKTVAPGSQNAVRKTKVTRTVAALVLYRSSSKGNCLLWFSYIQRDFARGEGNFRMKSIRGMCTTVCFLNSLRFPLFHLIKFRDTGKLLQTQQAISADVMPSHSFVQLNINTRNFIPLYRNTKFQEQFCSTIWKFLFVSKELFLLMQHCRPLLFSVLTTVFFPRLILEWKITEFVTELYLTLNLLLY